MRNSIIVLAMVGLLAATAGADWGHPVKWDQMSDGIDGYGAASWIDYDTPSDALTADDFLCGETGYITELEFGGFALGGNGYLDKFRVTFWSDVPSSPNDASHPGSLLYDAYIDKADPTSGIGWKAGEVADTYLINLPDDKWFTQEQGNIYWIGIQGVMVNDGSADAFYWSFAERHLPTWGDDAAFTSEYFQYPPWAGWGVNPNGEVDIYNGPLAPGWTSLDMAYRLHGTAVPEPGTIWLMSISGVGALAFYRRKK